MYYNNRILKVFMLVLSLALINISSVLHGEAISTKLYQAVQKGDLKQAEVYCAEVLFKSEDHIETAKMNVIMSMLLFLDLNPDAVYRSLVIRDFMKGANSRDEKSARLILLYLGRKLSGELLEKELQGSSPSWKATAMAARYIRILNEKGIAPGLLNRCVQQYMALSDKLEPGDLGRLWKTRLILWHNSLQNPDSDTSKLEPLIVKAKDDALNGPIKQQLGMLDMIIRDMLQNHKLEASRKIKKAFAALGAGKNKSENQAYLKLLNYLGGSAGSTQDVYEASMNQPDLFLMATIAIFVKKLSDAKSGGFYKATLSSYLDSFMKNVENSKEESVQNWKPVVENWKRWCDNDFPYSSSLQPLLATYSRVIAAKKREQENKTKIPAVYSKLKMCRSLNQVSLSDYKKVRAIFKDRPKPVSMDFDAPEFKTYVLSLPPEVQRGEWMRIAYMKKFKKNMIDNLNFSQYTGLIKLKTKSIKGKVIEADNQHITIKSRSGTKKYSWGDLSLEQYVVFAESYIKNNIAGKVNGKTNIFSTQDDTEQVMAKEYRLLAVFCDWYGNYSAALKFGKKADSYRVSQGAACKLLLQ